MRYTVIGLGQFGQELCLELSARNIEVVAVAATDEALEQVKDIVTYAVVTDYTNPASLRELELDAESSVIVAIGDSFEDNLLVTTHLQKMGVKNIYTRVISPVHEHILDLMGVFRINLSKVASRQLASQLESPEFLRVAPLDDTHMIAELTVPEIWVGKQLRDVELRTVHYLNLLTVRRGKLQNPVSSKEILDIPRVPILGTPSPDLVFEEHDILILFGTETNLVDFAQFAQGKNS